MEESGTPERGITTKPGGELQRLLEDSRYAKYGRLIFAALGSVPWVGGLIGASAALHAEREQGRVNETALRWFQEHERRIAELGNDLEQIINRLEGLGNTAARRVESNSYLSLVRRGFRVWDEAESREKRDLVRKTLTNAGGTTLCSDDVVRLFLDWIGLYHEVHFSVIRAIYKQPGATRARIWEDIHGADVREDSAEADLFKLLIRDLSTGSVIRQFRETTSTGQFVSRAGALRPRRRGDVLESAFEDTKPYVLTELGTQFVHYAMDEIVPRVEGGEPGSS